MRRRECNASADKGAGVPKLTLAGATSSWTSCRLDGCVEKLKFEGLGSREEREIKGLKPDDSSVPMPPYPVFPIDVVHRILSSVLHSGVPES